MSIHIFSFFSCIVQYVYIKKAEALCSIGMNLKVECNLLVFTRLVCRYQIEDLPKEDRTLLNIQTQKKISLQSDICYHHEKKYICKYEATQKYCANPFTFHDKRITKDLRTVDMKLSTLINIIPGQKLCRKCKTNANAIMNKENSDVDDEVNHEIISMTVQKL